MTNQMEEPVRAQKGLAHLIGGSLRLCAGTAAGHVVTLAVTPFVAKLYGPEAFGIWTGWLALAGVLASMACLSFETAIALPESDHEALHVAVTAMVFGGCVSLASGMFLVCVWRLGIAGPWQHLGNYVVWIPLGSLVLVGVSVATQWLARLHRVSGLAKAKIWASSVTALIQLAMGWSGSAGGLIWGDVAGRSAGLWGRLREAWREQAHHVKSIRRENIIAVVRRYRDHSVWMTPTKLINTLGLQAPLLLMLSWHGETIGGQFSLVQRLLGLPLALLGQSVAQLFFPIMVKAHRSSIAAAMRLFLGLSGLLALVSGTLIGVVCCLDEAWLVTLLGFGWEGVERFLLPLSVLVGVQLVASTVSQTAIVLGAQKWFSAWVVFSLLATMGGMWIGDRRSAAEGAVWGLTIANAIGYVILWLSLFIRLLYLNGTLSSVDKRKP